MTTTYLETVENVYRLPNGKFQGMWFKHDILLEHVHGRSYSIRVTRYQRTPQVPVTVTVENNLIDVYLGYETYD